MQAVPELQSVRVSNTGDLMGGILQNINFDEENYHESCHFVVLHFQRNHRESDPLVEEQYCRLRSWSHL